MRFLPRKMSVAEQEALLGPLPKFRAKVRSQMLHILMTLVAGWIVTTLTHRPLVMVPLLLSSWMASIFTFAAGAVPLWRLVASTAVTGIIFYFVARFVLPA